MVGNWIRAKAPEKLNILLVGNNPIDMGSVLEKLNQIRGAKIMTEIAFDLKSSLERLVRFKPNYILIDDNIGKAELSETVRTFSEKNKTKNVPIAVLKNSNYHESLASNVVLEYLLKTNLSAERLYTTLRNAFRLRKTQLYLYKAYKRKRNFFKKNV